MSRPFPWSLGRLGRLGLTIVLAHELEPRSFAFYIKEDVHELRLNQIPCESKIISGGRFLVMKDIYMHVSYEKAVGTYVCV